MRYTPIIIKPIFEGKKYEAYFVEYVLGFSIETTIHGNTYQECKQNTANFLKVDINSLVMAEN